jgi:hypothetical protein
LPSLTRQSEVKPCADSGYPNQAQQQEQAFSDCLSLDEKFDRVQRMEARYRVADPAFTVTALNRTIACRHVVDN